MQTGNQAALIIVLFGITGDWAYKKIIPSLWHLFKQGNLPAQFAVVGFARRFLTKDEFKEVIYKSVKRYSDTNKQDTETSEFKNKFEQFFACFTYQSGHLENVDSFKTLAENISTLEDKFGSSANKLFYLGFAPEYFPAAMENLSAAGLNIASPNTWSRFMIEKPFGFDTQTAQELIVLLDKYLQPEQIYIIDHYLFKEIIPIIENYDWSKWENREVEKIEITTLETLDVKTRGAFYDSVGAFRDVGQNHLLILLAVLCKSKNKSIGESRFDILKTLAEWSEENLKKNTFRAQHVGYRDIAGVDPNSNKETFFCIKN